MISLKYDDLQSILAKTVHILTPSNTICNKRVIVLCSLRTTIICRQHLLFITSNQHGQHLHTNNTVEVPPSEQSHRLGQSHRVSTNPTIGYNCTSYRTWVTKILEGCNKPWTFLASSFKNFKALRIPSKPHIHQETNWSLEWKRGENEYLSICLGR